MFTISIKYSMCQLNKKNNITLNLIHRHLVQFRFNRVVVLAVLGVPVPHQHRPFFQVVSRLMIHRQTDDGRYYQHVDQGSRQHVELPRHTARLSIQVRLCLGMIRDISLYYTILYYTIVRCVLISCVLINDATITIAIQDINK